MNITQKTFSNLCEPTFDYFNEFISYRIEEAILKAIPEFLKRKIDPEKGGDATLELPWGTYTADVVKSGEGTNINVAYKPSKIFLKLLNEDSGVNRERYQETIDREYLELVSVYTRYQSFTASPKEPMPKNSINVPDNELTYLINEYMQALGVIGRDKRRSGKSYRLEINDSFPFGNFDFEYEDDEVKVKFTPHKAFKQYLKDDSIAEKAAAADFSQFVAQHYDAEAYGKPGLKFLSRKAKKRAKKSRQNG